MKKKFYCVLAIVLALSLAGCSWSVGMDSQRDDRSYDEIFTWGNESKIHTTKTYRVELGEYGGMNLILDTSLGHSFELDGSTNSFTVTDKEGETIVLGHFVSQENYSNITALYDNLDIRNVNNRDLAVVYDEILEKHLAFTYLADCGLDVGLMMEGSGNDAFQYLAFSGEALPNGSADIHHYLGTPAQDNEEPQQPQSEDTWEITFTNEKGFDASKYDLKLVDTDIFSSVNSYEVQTGSYDTQNILEAALRFDTTATELAASLTENIKTSSGVTPVLDIHEEGVYLTGLYEGMITLAFITDGADSTTYVLCLYSSDTENCIDILNSIIDDFLASGIVESSGRTAYGELVKTPDSESGSSDGTPAGGGNLPGLTVPAGYSLTYEGEFLISYGNDTTDISFYVNSDEEFLRFLHGETDNYYNVYQMATVGSYESENYGEIHIAEGSSDSLYKYFAGNESGTVVIQFSSNYWTKLSLEECVELLKQFIK